MLEHLKPPAESFKIYFTKSPLKLASLHLLNSICPYDSVFYVLRALPLLADKLYYEASVVALNWLWYVIKLIIDGKGLHTVYCIQDYR